MVRSWNQSKVDQKAHAFPSITCPWVSIAEGPSRLAWMNTGSQEAVGKQPPPYQEVGDPASPPPLLQQSLLSNPEQRTQVGTGTHSPASLLPAFVPNQPPRPSFLHLRILNQDIHVLAAKRHV